MTSSSSMDQQISAILGADLTHLETLILDLMTPSNEQRSQAEFLFNSCKEDLPDNLVVNLAELLEHSPRLDVRAMSAILLRNIVQDELPLWNSLLEMTQLRVKRGLQNCVVNEENKPIIKILANTISMLAADNYWPELRTFMFKCVESVDFWLKESALLIFAQLPQYVHSMYLYTPIWESLVPHKTRLHDVFMDCLGNGGSADVRIAAMSAVINFIPCRFKDLLPRMLQCVTEALNLGNEATAQKALVLLIELAGVRPKYFREREREWVRMVEVVEVVEGMLQIAEAESLEEGTRHLAIEFVFTLTEILEEPFECVIMSAEGARWDLPQFIINRLCAILMRMLLDIEDEAAWHSAENEDEDAGRSSNYIFGKECLHRLATALGGNTILPVAYEYLSAPNDEWQKHLAGLVALAVGYIRCTHEVMMRVLTKGLNEGEEVTKQKALKLLIEWAHQIKHPWCKLEQYLGAEWQKRVIAINILALAKISKVYLKLMKYFGSYDTKSRSYYSVNSDNYFWGSEFRLFSSAIKIAESQCLRETKHLAIEFLIMSAEEKCYLPQFIINSLCAILMRMLLDIEDEDADEDIEDEDEDIEDEDEDIFGKKCLHRLATALGGNTIVPVAYEYLSAPNHEWQKHLAGLVALAQIAKGPSKLVEIPNLEQVVTMVLKSFRDPSHPRVKWAAIDAIGQLSTYVGPSLLDQYHNLLLPDLAKAIYDDRDPRVRLAVINAIGQLSTYLGPSLLDQYHNLVLPRLAKAIYDDPDPLVRLAAINATIQYHRLVLPALAKAIHDFKYPQVQKDAASAVINIIKNYPQDTLTPDLVEIVGTLLEFRSREDIASDQTRILAIENLLKQFRVKLPPDTWASTRSQLLDHQEELLKILAHKEDQEEST